MPASSSSVESEESRIASVSVESDAVDVDGVEAGGEYDRNPQRLIFQPIIKSQHKDKSVEAQMRITQRVLE